MKTRLSVEQQLERTLILVLEKYAVSQVYHQYSDEEQYGHFYFGVVLRPLRLFNEGDIVAIRLNNGGGERWPVTAISSKGYKIVDMYLSFKSTFPNWRRMTHSRQGHRNFRLHPWPEGDRRCNAAVVQSDQPNQPIKFLDLMRKWQADPTVQREIVATLRAGSVERSVGAGIGA